MQVRFPGTNLKFAAAIFVFVLPLGTAGLATAQVEDNGSTGRLQLAESYVRAGQFDRAAPILEELRKSDPTSVVIYDRLKTAYEGLKRYDDAIRLVREMMQQEAHPSPAAMADLAALQYKAGDENAAHASWDEALRMAPNDRNTYRTVYFSLVQHRLFDRAIEILLEGRSHFNEPGLFQMDLAYLYSIIGRHAEAMREYLDLLAEDARQVNFVKSRLGRHTEQPEALEVLIDETERAVRRDPLNRGYRELAAWLYAEKGAFDKALDANRAIDRLEDEQGRILFNFAQAAARAGAYDVAGEAFREIMNRYPNSPVAANVQFGIGYMFQRQARDAGERPGHTDGEPGEAPFYEAAIDAYTAFIDKHPGHNLVSEALRSLAAIYQDVYFDLDRAEEVLDRIVREYPASEAAQWARFDLARVGLHRGELPKARIMFARLEEELRTGDLAERARFETAMVDFYLWHFETALSRVRSMTQNYASDVANNAIELRLMLQENIDDTLTTALRQYADAMFLKRQREYEETLQIFDAITEAYPHHQLHDEIRYQRAVILRERGLPEQAIAALQEVRRLHPNSYLADRSLLMEGEIYEDEVRDAAAAMKAYEDLLVKYPNSLFAHQARARLRSLRGDGV